MRQSGEHDIEFSANPSFLEPFNVLLTSLSEQVGGGGGSPSRGGGVPSRGGGSGGGGGGQDPYSENRPLNTSGTGSQTHL